MIGILGGGQLGRMIAQAASRFGLKSAVFAPEPLSPAFDTAQISFRAEYSDASGLARFAKRCSVVTCEFENVPTSVLEHVGSVTRLCPSPQAFAIAQDRRKEKAFFKECGFPTAPWQEVLSLESLREALETIGTPALLKSTRSGYDGKNQIALSSHADAESAWQRLPTACILEKRLSFECELSVIAARRAQGQIAVFCPTRNRHEKGILIESVVPSGCRSEVLKRAESMVEQAIEVLALEGLLALELFVMADGTLFANEMAPRPHNSGHWTIDAAPTSQFEQLLRAILDLPLGASEPIIPARMLNLLGDAWHSFPRVLEQPRACLHLYGKHETRKGRKMGHVTFLAPEETSP